MEAAAVIAVPAQGQANAQTALDRIAEWCVAWGMEVGTGQGKIKAVAIEPLAGALPLQHTPPAHPAPSPLLHWHIINGAPLKTPIRDSSA